MPSAAVQGAGNKIPSSSHLAQQTALWTVQTPSCASQLHTHQLCCPGVSTLQPSSQEYQAKGVKVGVQPGQLHSQSVINSMCPCFDHSLAPRKQEECYSVQGCCSCLSA
jgi:hypothetical protein